MRRGHDFGGIAVKGLVDDDRLVAVEQDGARFMTHGPKLSFQAPVLASPPIAGTLVAPPTALDTSVALKTLSDGPVLVPANKIGRAHV